MMYRVCNPLNIPVGPILSMKEIAADQSLRDSGTIVEVDHPERGSYLSVGNPVKLSASPSEVERSPLLGEHTDEILGGVLGMSEEENSVGAEPDQERLELAFHRYGLWLPPHTVAAVSEHHRQNRPEPEASEENQGATISVGEKVGTAPHHHAAQLRVTNHPFEVGGESRGHE